MIFSVIKLFNQMQYPQQYPQQYPPPPPQPYSPPYPDTHHSPSTIPSHLRLLRETLPLSSPSTTIETKTQTMETCVPLA